MTTTRDWIALSMVRGLGATGFWGLVHRFGSPSAVLAASAEQWRQTPGLRQESCAERTRGIPFERAESELDRLKKIGARVLTWEDDDYPEALRTTAVPPPVLYIRGSAALLRLPAVAMIGSRSATSYGKRVANSIARDLAGYGVCVVSGLAQGIDGEAHRGCLAAGGATIGVLGCGLDVVYPRSHGMLYAQLAQSGLLISEYPLGTRPEPFRFPARNRIIAGLCRGVVVVEAARRSGTLITVQHALDEGREVFAVPGQIDSAKSTGSHWLIQQGAGLVVHADDIVSSLGIALPQDQERSSSDAGQISEDPEIAAVLELLEPYPQSRDEVLNTSQLDSGRLSEILLLLEIDGLIECLPGGRVRRLA